MVLVSGKRLFGKRFRLLLLACFLVAGFVQISVAVQAEDAPPAPVVQPAAPEPEAAPVEKGDYNTGKMLFAGEKAFQNGGPPCISCHSAGVGGLGGGVLGPNLTKAFADPSKNPLMSTAWVNGGGSPVMGPIFSNKKITDEEMGHLRAFFKSASEKGVEPSPTGTFTILGLGGFVGMLVLFGIIWSGRYSKRNQNTAHDALWRNYGGKGGR
ncbi:MAG: hypothetical protein HZB80_05430 [Deltaproteobacteria bacterium]|nr:hypothetical protein [Deltaproteobacteria bacterium]